MIGIDAFVNLAGISLAVVVTGVIIALGFWLRNIRRVLRVALQDVAQRQLNHQHRHNDELLTYQKRLLKIEEQVLILAKHQQKMLEQLNATASTLRQQAQKEAEANDHDDQLRRVIH